MENSFFSCYIHENKIKAKFGREENVMDKTTFMNMLKESRAQWEEILAQIDEEHMTDPAGCNG